MRNKAVEYQMCFLSSFTPLSETFLTIRRSELDRSKMYIGLHVNYPLFFSEFNETWNYLDRFSKNIQYQI
jgi:hypothetical protein